MKKHMSAIVGATLGIVLLAIVAAFGIFLPKAEGNATSQAPALPDRVGSLVALDSGRLPATLQQQIGGTAQVVQAERQATASLEKLYGDSVAYRFYASSDAQAIVAVTALPGDPGLFSPDGPSIATPGQQATYRLTKVSGAVCAEYYSQPSTGTAQPGAALQLARVHCQLGADGRTYDVDARGLSVARTVAALKRLTAA